MFESLFEDKDVGVLSVPPLIFLIGPEFDQTLEGRPFDEHLEKRDAFKVCLVVVIGFQEALLVEYETGVGTARDVFPLPVKALPLRLLNAFLQVFEKLAEEFEEAAADFSHFITCQDRFLHHFLLASVSVLSHPLTLQLTYLRQQVLRELFWELRFDLIRACFGFKIDLSPPGLPHYISV